MMHEEELLSVEDGGKPYVVVPGPVVSKNDGQTHYIGAYQLMRLYGVSPSNCLVFDSRRHLTDPTYIRRNAWMLRDKIELLPNYDGDYRLPEERYLFPAE